jgi:hypothetical protein
MGVSGVGVVIVNKRIIGGGAPTVKIKKTKA